MAKSDNPQGMGEQSKEPFIKKDDRPEVKISLDTPLSELRVRELSAILGFMTGKNPNFEVGKTSIKDFFDKPFPETVKDWVKELKSEKLEKVEKIEKNEKNEKNEKLEKYEKIEKPERKELKLEKIEHDGVFEQGIPIGPDPRLEQVIQAVTGLTKQVSVLTNQIEEMRKKG